MNSVQCFLLFGLVLIHGIEATKGKGGGGYSRGYGGSDGGGGYGGGHGGGGHVPAAQQHIIIVPAPHPVFYHVPASRPAPALVSSYSSGGYGGSHGSSTAGHGYRQVGGGGSYTGHEMGPSGGYQAHTGGAPVHVYVHASGATPTYRPASGGHYQAAPVVPSYQQPPSYHAAPVVSYGGGSYGGSGYGGGGYGGGGYGGASSYQASVPSYGSSHAVGGY